jgi:glycosyltransferase involved in cell wall biosynthesis
MGAILRPEQGIQIVFITTVPETAHSFLNQQIRFFTAHGFEVRTVSSPVSGQVLEKLELRQVTHEVAMKRAMSPFHDLIAIARLWRLLRRLQPEIVHTHTPKAGFLGIIAARLAGVPIRIYTVNGLAILTQPFWARPLLAVSESLACRLATRVLCVSRSVRRFMIASGFCPRDRCRTLGDGGSHGVDTERFDPAVHGPLDRAGVRAQCGIPDDAMVLGFVGRIIPEKGIAELALAWKTLRTEFLDLKLLLCGYCEPAHPLAPGVIEEFRSDPRVHFTMGRVTDMPSIYASMDICVLPSYREGLTNVALECAAMQVPIVSTRVPGCADAIRNGITGLLVKPRDSEALTRALRQLIQNSDLRKRMGVAARSWVCRRFSEVRVSGLLLEEYRELMKMHLSTRNKVPVLTVRMNLSEAEAHPAPSPQLAGDRSSSEPVPPAE